MFVCGHYSTLQFDLVEKSRTDNRCLKNITVCVKIHNTALEFIESENTEFPSAPQLGGNYYADYNLQKMWS